MFSGITNQFTSLVGAVKGGQADEDVPAPTGDANAATTAVTETPVAATENQNVGDQPLEGEEGAKRLSPSFVDSFVAEATGWLGSAKGWLGSASIPSMPAMPTMAMPSMPAMPAMPSIPSIPGLRKGGAEAGEAGEGVVGEGQALDPTGAVSGDDEDKSRYISATEGADSHPASGGGTPTGDEGQIGQVTTKVTQQAKHFGSFLSSAINKAGAKIKETVKDNTILDSFNKEQEAFIKGQGGTESGAAPWIGHNNEAKIKEEILGLSQDRRNFVRAPPAGVDFEFNYDASYPTAIAIMAEDKALETMRFELVPKIITEENFWRNYFYRVSLIIQAAELGTLGADGVGQASSEDVSTLRKPPKNLTFNGGAKAYTPLSLTSVAAYSLNSGNLQSHKFATKVESTKIPNEKFPKSNKDEQCDQQQQQQQRQQEKVKALKTDSSILVSSISPESKATDLLEIKDGMLHPGIHSINLHQAPNEGGKEEQWEKDLEAELKDYEVVSDDGGGGGGGTRGITRNGDGSGGGDGDDLPSLSNLRMRSTNNDWEEYADLIEDTDDLK